jgi:hypothetical protein
MATQRLGLGVSVSVSVGVDRRSGALLGVDQGKGKGKPPARGFPFSRLVQAVNDRLNVAIPASATVCAFVAL